MEPGQDQDDCFFILDERRALFQEMGHTTLEQKYEGVMFRSLAIEYDIVFIASYERRNFGLSDVRHMAHTMYADSYSCPSKAKQLAGPGMVLKVAGHNASNMQCTY